MSFRFLGFLFVFITLLLSCTTTSTLGNVEVQLKEESFLIDGSKMAKMEVQQGSLVVFNNIGKTQHDLYASTGETKFSLGLSKPGDVQEYRFEKKGSIPVKCSIHPNMELWISVH